ncbi:TolC family protein [Sphingomonas lenta]|uniref:Type I secretion protein TolC n=1 Tax=Sphingomonas lenta TaxID=1141887 RepID=A0A2A2SF02_9SPHN|nr:TolC family protein [Sphingomonas lenta]PAX07772.1 type I secretion protein TolC [Sphingomonas lenta]
MGAASLAAMASAAAAQQDGIPTGPRPPVYAPSLPEQADPAVAARPVAQPVATLREAIAVAYSTNPNLLAQRASLRSTDNRLPAARAQFGPQLDLAAAQSYQRDRFEILPRTFNGRQGFSNTAQAVFNQPLFTFGRLRSAEEQARAEIALGRDSLRLQEAQILLDVVTAFVSVQRETNFVNISQQNLDLLGRQYRDSAERFRVREITSTDLQQIETRVELGRAQLLEAQGRLNASRADFLNAVGAPAAIELAEPEPLPLGAETVEAAYDYAEVNSALIRAAQSREKISRAGVAAARAEQRPRLDLRGSAAYGTTTPYSSDLRTTQLRGDLTFSMPLIDSGLRRANERAALEANEADWRLIDQALRDVRLGVGSSWSQLTAARAAIVNYTRAEDAARRAYEGALEQEKAGARTTLDVLDLLRDLLNTRLNLITVQANEYIARANLLAAMGRLEGPLLVPDIRAYDPTENFERVRGKGDIPLITPALSSLEGLVVRDNRSDRPIRDPAGRLETEPPVLKAEPALPPLTRR